jgi:hypothetical protein
MFESSNTATLSKWNCTRGKCGRERGSRGTFTSQTPPPPHMSLGGSSRQMPLFGKHKYGCVCARVARHQYNLRSVKTIAWNGGKHGNASYSGGS